MEINQRGIFTGVEKGAGENKNNVLLIMIKDRTNQGSNWVGDNYGDYLTFTDDKQCGCSIPMKKDRNRNSERDAEDCMKD